MLGPDDDDALAEMLDALSEASGIDLGDIMQDQPDEEPKEDLGELSSFEEGEIGELEDTVEDDLDMENNYGDGFEEYLSDLFDDMDVDTGENDAYADAEV